MYKTIIFDVDGTLLDTERAVFNSYKKVFEELLNRDFGSEEMKAAYGVPTRQVLEYFGVKQIDEFCKAYLVAIMDAYHEVHAFEGVHELLHEVKERGLTTGIVTSRNHKETYDDLCMHKVTAYMQHIICAEDTHRHKPDPEPALKFLEISNADRDETIYLGDTIFDADCARGAGIPFALALWGAKNPENIKSDYYLEKPADLIRLLK